MKNHKVASKKALDTLFRYFNEKKNTIIREHKVFDNFMLPSSVTQEIITKLNEIKLAAYLEMLNKLIELRKIRYVVAASIHYMYNTIYLTFPNLINLFIFTRYVANLISFVFFYYFLYPSKWATHWTPRMAILKFHVDRILDMPCGHWTLNVHIGYFKWTAYWLFYMGIGYSVSSVRMVCLICSPIGVPDIQTEYPIYNPIELSNVQ